MGKCNLCTDEPADTDLLDHIRVMHPGEYGNGPARWPDGGLVFIDQTGELPGELGGNGA